MNGSTSGGRCHSDALSCTPADYVLDHGSGIRNETDNLGSNWAPGAPCAVTWRSHPPPRRHVRLLNPPEAQAVWPGLLTSQSAGQGPILEVETHRASIDEVVADIYEHWLHRPG
jgi:hypothetical protein